MAVDRGAGLLARLRSDPLGFLRRGLWKLLLGPLRYRTGDGYAAERYWHDRFARHGRSLRAVGHEGLSDAANASMYADAERIFRDTCVSEGIDLALARVLEIGCGTGFYTGLCRQLGVKHYTGVDITDVFFEQLRADYPEYTFNRADITQTAVDGCFDVVIMIDVLEHIVSHPDLESALANVERSIAAGGAFIFALPTSAKSERALFYLRFWSLREILARLPYWSTTQPTPFRDGHLIVARSPQAPTTPDDHSALA